MFKIEIAWDNSSDAHPLYGDVTFWLANEIVRHPNWKDTDSMYVDTTVLAEWWLRNCPAILFEQRDDFTPYPSEDDLWSWTERHNLKAAGFGYFWPNIEFVSEGDEFIVANHNGIRHVLSATEVENAFDSYVDLIVDRLEEKKDVVMNVTIPLMRMLLEDIRNNPEAVAEIKARIRSGEIVQMYSEFSE